MSSWSNSAPFLPRSRSGVRRRSKCRAIDTKTKWMSYPWTFRVVNRLQIPCTRLPIVEVLLSPSTNFTLNTFPMFGDSSKHLSLKLFNVTWKLFCVAAINFQYLKLTMIRPIRPTFSRCMHFQQIHKLHSHLGGKDSKLWIDSSKLKRFIPIITCLLFTLSPTYLQLICDFRANILGQH